MAYRVLSTAVALILALTAVSCGGPAPAAPTALPAPNSSPSTNTAALPPAQQPVSEPNAPASLAASSPSTPPAAVAIFSQPPRPAGGLLLSSLNARDENSTSQWVWESFAFDRVQTITEVRWRGAYDPNNRGAGGPVRDFTVEIYASIPVGAEPDVAARPLVQYKVGGNAGETPAGKVGGVETYDYRFTLEVPFEAAPYTPYWLLIEALQSGAPDWGLVQAVNGDSQHFRRRVIGSAANYFQMAPGDPAIEILALSAEGGGSDLESVVTWDREITRQPLPPAEIIAVNAEGVQEVVLVISRSGYTPTHFAVKAGVPVRVVFRQLGYVPGGNILLVRWGAQEEKYLTLDSLTEIEILEFTPQESGDFRFNCPHYWYEGVMTVQG